LDSYYYDLRRKTYALVFRLGNKSLGQTLLIQDVFFDKVLLDQIHPIDAYKVGIIFGMCRNEIIINQPNQTLNPIGQPFQNQSKIKPMFKIKSIPVVDGGNDIILNLVDTNYEFNINLNDIQNQQFLLYGLDQINAATVGLLVSECFIKKFNFNM
jgi:hypothetical protein